MCENMAKKHLSVKDNMQLQCLSLGTFGSVLAPWVRDTSIGMPGEANMGSPET